MGSKRGYSPTYRLDSAVESVQSDVEWEQRIRGQFVEISPIWAWQMKNAAVAWQMPEAHSGVLVDVSYCFYCKISALTATASYGLGGWGFESLWVHHSYITC